MNDLYILDLWLMPPDNLHMTALEIVHSLTESEISARIDLLAPKLKEIADYTFTHRTKLVRPMVSYDSAALALSFVPSSNSEDGIDTFTYHHLRRDLHNLCTATGVDVESRYVAPSAHLTIARFVTQDDITTKIAGQFEIDTLKVQGLISQIDCINDWLKDEVWPNCEHSDNGGQWYVGSERGLDCQRGALWFGDGQRVGLGKGF